MEERSTQIFQTLQKKKQELKQEAEKADEKQDELWREQGKIISNFKNEKIINFSEYQRERPKKLSCRSERSLAGPERSTGEPPS
jgi:hypothetical protein